MGLGFRVQGSGFRVQGLEFRVQVSGFRVYGFGEMSLSGLLWLLTLLKVLPGDKIFCGTAPGKHTRPNTDRQKDKTPIKITAFNRDLRIS